MKVRSLLFTLITIVLCSCGGHDTIENPIVGNSIEIISIDPAPNSKLNKSSIISAYLKYKIDPAEKSDYGFKIMIQFTKPGDSTSYSFQPNSIDVNSYSGTVTLDHSILKEW